MISDLYESRHETPFKLLLALFSVPFSQDGSMGHFRGFSSLFVEVLTV